MGLNDGFDITYPYFNSDNFVGREAELQFLKTRLIEEKKHVGLVSGRPGIGKTSLVRCFADRNAPHFGYGIEVVSMPLTRHSMPKLKPDTKLVLIDNIHAQFFPSATHQVLSFIDKNPDQQYLLIDHDGNELLDRHINYRLTLDHLTDTDAIKMLMRLLQKRLPEKEIVKFMSLTQGHPYLVTLIAHYLNDPYTNYTLAELQRIVWENISATGVTDVAGRPVAPESPIYRQIVHDIQIINGSALNNLKYRPEDIYKLQPREFEEMMAELMEKQGYKVDLTKATRDGGKDLIVARHQDLGNFIYYVECKQYSPNNPVGVNLVRELAGAVHADRVTAGILITSSYFSPDAVAFSEKIKHQMSLVDFVKLREWLNAI